MNPDLAKAFQAVLNAQFQAGIAVGFFQALLIKELAAKATQPIQEAADTRQCAEAADTRQCAEAPTPKE